jgi:hypothetical protein
VATWHQVRDPTGRLDGCLTSGPCGDGPSTPAGWHRSGRFCGDTEGVAQRPYNTDPPLRCNCEGPTSLCLGEPAKSRTHRICWVCLLKRTIAYPNFLPAGGGKRAGVGM